MFKCPYCGKDSYRTEFKKCNNCREIISDEVFAKLEGDNFQENIIENKSKKQSINNATHKKIGRIFQMFAIVIFCLDVIGSFIISANGTELNVTTLIAGLLSGFIFFAFFYGFGEIIDRLISIDEKLSNK